MLTRNTYCGNTKTVYVEHQNQNGSNDTWQLDSRFSIENDTLQYIVNTVMWAERRILVKNLHIGTQCEAHAQARGWISTGVSHMYWLQL